MNKEKANINVGDIKSISESFPKNGIPTELKRFIDNSIKGKIFHSRETIEYLKNIALPFFDIKVVKFKYPNAVSQFQEFISSVAKAQPDLFKKESEDAQRKVFTIMSHPMEFVKYLFPNYSDNLSYLRTVLKSKELSNISFNLGDSEIPKEKMGEVLEVFDSITKREITGSLALLNTFIKNQDSKKENTTVTVGIDLELPVKHLELLDDRKGYDIKNSLLEIIENFDTGFSDSSNLCKRELKEKIFEIIPLEVQNFKHFCNILQFLINTMHLDANDFNFLNKSADDFWEEHKDDKRISFETNWFQPKIHEILVRQFGEEVKKEVDEVRGSTDFLVHSIPIECKVITDKMKYRENMSGLEILEKHESQSFQETIHCRCGYLIAFDYRKEKVKDDLKKSAIVERIKFKIQGHKIIVLLVFLGNLDKPSK